MNKLTKSHTHTLLEKLTPALLLPRQLSYHYEFNEKLALKLDQLDQIREKHMNGIVVEHLVTRQGTDIFLKDDISLTVKDMLTCMISRW